MRAMAVFPGERELRIVELPRPEPKGEHDVTVKVREVGICGTDREICGFHYGTPPTGSERLVLGHEALGEVVDVGPSVRSFARGIWWRSWCGGPARMRRASLVAPAVRTSASPVISVSAGSTRPTAS